jgi:serine/threonine protein kinase
MGVVYRALDLQTQRPVAIKRLARGANPNQVSRFQREGEALARLDHSGIVSVLELGRDSRDPYIVLELVSGESLEDVMRGRGRLPEAEVIRLGRGLAEALAYSHEREVLHRDVKPDNIILVRSQPVLVDFGLAKLEQPSGDRLTATGTLAGTAGYAAPEQLADASKVGRRADVYGLGATLYALLTGAPPGGDMPAVSLFAVALAGSFPSPRSLGAEVSRELNALVMRALAREPDERWTMAELADALAKLERAQRAAPARRSLRLAGGVLAAAFLGGIALVIALESGPGSQTQLQTQSPSPSLASPGPATPTPTPTPTSTPAPLARAATRLRQLEGSALPRVLPSAPREIQAGAEGAFRFRLEPSEFDLQFQVPVAQDTGTLDVQIQGCDADVDLYADPTGPAELQAPWNSTDLAHSERLTLGPQSQPPLRGGVVHFRIHRRLSWPEPVVGVVVVRRSAVGATPPVRWESVWDCDLAEVPTDLEPTLARAHELFLARKLEALEALLRPHQARAPHLVRLRVKFLLGLGAARRIPALAAEVEALGQEPSLQLRYGLVGAALFAGDLDLAISRCDELLADNPQLLEAATMAGRLELGLGRQDAAQTRLSALAERDPEDLRIKSLLLQVQMAAGDEAALRDAEELLRSNPPALLAADRASLLSTLVTRDAGLADELFELYRSTRSRPTASEAATWVRFLLRRGRKVEARRLLIAIDAGPLAPAAYTEIAELRGLVRK